MCGAWHPIAVSTGIVIAGHVFQAMRQTMDVITMFINTYQNQAWLTVIPAVVNTDALAVVIAENLVKHGLTEGFSIDTGGWVRKFFLILINAGADLMYFKLPAGAIKREWLFYVFHCIEGLSRSFFKYVA